MTTLDNVNKGRYHEFLFKYMLEVDFKFNSILQNQVKFVLTYILWIELNRGGISNMSN